MYNFEEFVTQVKNGLERVLKNRYGNAKVSVVTRKKVNCEMVGLECHVPNKYAINTTVYMESFYNAYLKHGNINAIIARATDTLAETMKEYKYMRNKVDNLKNTTDGIVFQLIHTEENKEILKTMPHRNFMDMSIVYRCILDISDDRMLSAPVTHAYADMLGFNEEELYQLAFENTRYIMEPTVYTMEQVIEGLEEALGMKGEIMGEATMERPPLYVITNSKRTWGAASVLYKGKLLSLAEKLDSDLYLIPSSTHEMIITPAKQKLLGVVESTLYEANQNVVDIRERLSNEIYLYDRKSNSITRVTDSPRKMLDDGPTESMGMGMC